VTCTRGAAVVASVALLILSSTAKAHAAPDTSACIAAFDQGQRAKTDRKLRRAQAELLVCTQESCPAVLRADCAGVLRNVQAALPTIVLAADDGEGHDISDVKVVLGTEVIAESLDGRALEFDPGTYDFRFERADARTPKSGELRTVIIGAPPVVTVHHVLREGEKNRVVRASFRRKPLERERPMEPAPKRPFVGYLVPASLAFLGVAGLGAAAYSRLTFDGDVEDMRSRCAPDCTQAERSDLSSTLVTANVSLGVGIGAIVLAGVSWFLLSPRAAARTTATADWRAW
jgi:hypothetical protein